MHTIEALSQLNNFTDTPDEKDVTPLNILQHFTPNHIEHSHSHLVENLYAHKTDIRHNASQKKTWQTTQTKATNSNQ